MTTPPTATAPTVPGRLARRLGGAALAALVVGALAGCLKLDGDLQIEGDTVSGTIVTALNAEQAAVLQLEPDDVFSDLGLERVDGVTTAPYDEGGWDGIEYTFDRVQLSDLNQMSEGDPDGLRITRDQEAGTYEFRAVLDFSFLADLEEQPSDPEVPLDPQDLLETFETTVAVTFPAEVTEHNGELSGTTVSWAPEPGERAELRAVAGGESPGGSDDGPGGSDQPGEPGQTGEPGRSGQPGGTAPPGTERDPAAATEDTGGGSSGAVAALVAVGVLAALAAGGVAGWLVLRSRRNREPGEAVE